MPWWMFLVAAFAAPLTLLGAFVIGGAIWRRGVAHGKAEATESLDTSMGLLEKKVQELAELKGALAPAAYRGKAAEEVSEWAESVVRLWKTLRSKP